MEDNHRGARPNVASYPKLIEFYEGVLANKTTSLRTRMSAAKQLDSILMRLERLEASEARKADKARRDATRSEREAVEIERQAAVYERESAAERARANLQKILPKSS